MTIAANFPSIRPSLLLDFANTEVLDPRITFSRPTTATYYDNHTTAVAEQNLILWSQDYTNAVWNNTTSNVTVVADNATAPDGTTTADTATFTGSSYRYEGVTTGNILGQTGTISVWLSSLTGKDTIGLRIAGATTSADSAFSLVSLTTTPTRYTVSRTFTSTDTVFLIGLDNRSSVVGGAQTTGNVIVWGFQFEVRSSATAYNATTTTAITNYIPVLQTAATNTARFDHNPTTRESLGLLIEEQRTNLLTYSSDFSNATWTKSNLTVTSDIIIAPDGTQTGDKLVEDATTNEHKTFTAAISATSGTAYSFSFYAKLGERTIVGAAFTGPGVSNIVTGCYINLSTQAVTNFGSAPTSTTVTSVGNNWYRIVLVYTATATASIYAQLYTIQTVGALSYTGNGFSGIYIWGAQLEAGAFATSYIPTVASQVTRSADTASMTGTNFSSWYNNAEGTMYAEASTVSNGNACAYGIGDSTSNVMRMFKQNSNQAVFQVVISGAFAANLGMATTWTSGYGKIASVYKTDDFSTSFNGGTPVTDTAGAVPVVNTTLTIGIAAGVSSLNGYIKKLSYYPIRVTNAQLQGLTG